MAGVAEWEEHYILTLSKGRAVDWKLRSGLIVTHIIIIRSFNYNLAD